MTMRFQKYNGGYSNYVDIENGDEYWISGLKKRESNRHWAGHGKIMINRRAVNEYLTLIGEKELPLNLFEIIDIEDRFPVERVNKLLNDKDKLNFVREPNERKNLSYSMRNDSLLGKRVKPGYNYACSSTGVDGRP